MFRTADPAVHALDRVQGSGTSYHCPTPEAIYGHLRGIQARIARAAGHAPLTVVKLRRDVDLLLDRLSYLAIMGDEGHEP